jgi:hypothetical protein
VQKKASKVKPEQQQQQPWGVFSSLAQLDALMDWLNPQGVREGPLRAALQRVKDNMLLFAPPPSQHTAAAGGEGGALQQQQQQHEAHSSRAGTPALTAAPAAVPAAAGSRLAQDSSKQQQQPHQPPAAAAVQQQLVAAAAAQDDAAAAEALRDGLARFMAGLPEASLHPFWGSISRCEAWRAALTAAQRPADFAALIAQVGTTTHPEDEGSTTLHTPSAWMQ